MPLMAYFFLYLTSQNLISMILNAMFYIIHGGK